MTRRPHPPTLLRRADVYAFAAACALLAGVMAAEAAAAAWRPLCEAAARIAG